jgi:hypothetical protein
MHSEHDIIPALWRLSKEDHKLEASLGYTGKPCLKKKKRGECKTL